MPGLRELQSWWLPQDVFSLCSYPGISHVMKSHGSDFLQGSWFSPGQMFQEIGRGNRKSFNAHPTNGHNYGTCAKFYGSQ